MSRRSRLSTSQTIDLAHRRRTRTTGIFSEQPVPIQTDGLPGAGEGGTTDPTMTVDNSWLSPDLSWVDGSLSWMGV